MNSLRGFRLLAIIAIAIASGIPCLAAESLDDSIVTVIRQLDDRERLAILTRNVAALDSLFSDSLVVNAPRNVVSRKDEVLQLVKEGRIHYDSFERVIEFLRVDGDLAVVMGRETVVPAKGSPSAGETVHRRFTDIWRNERGTWRLYVRQATILAR